MRPYMKHRQTDAPPVAAAKTGFSEATAYRLEDDPSLPSQKARSRDRRRPDPLAVIFEAEVVPLLESAPELQPVAIFAEMRRSREHLDPMGRRHHQHIVTKYHHLTERTDRSASGIRRRRGRWRRDDA
jgi:hypothetical protein